MIKINMLTNHYFNQTKSFITFSDLQSRYLRGNNTALAWLGYNSEDDLIEKTYCDIPCKASEQHENFVLQDQVVMSIEHVKIFGLYCYAGDQWKIILAEKTLLKNEKQKPEYIVSVLHDLTHSHIVDIGKFISLTNSNIKNLKLNQTGYVLGQQPLHKVSERQLECLFFLMRGKTTKEIAEILNLSFRTIETHINQLKTKWHCTTKSQLIETGIANGYMNYLPESIFHFIRK